MREKKKKNRPSIDSCGICVCVCDVTRGVATSVKRSCPLMRCDDDDFSRKRRHKELETTGKKNNPKEREKERREEEEEKPRVYM